MNTKDHTCASCEHNTLDGRFCHLWNRPTDLNLECQQHRHATELEHHVAVQYRKEGGGE